MEVEYSKILTKNLIVTVSASFAFARFKVSVYVVHKQTKTFFLNLSGLKIHPKLLSDISQLVTKRASKPMPAISPSFGVWRS